MSWGPTWWPPRTSRSTKVSGEPGSPLRQKLQTGLQRSVSSPHVVFSVCFFLFFCLFFIKRFLSRDPEPLSSHKFCTTWAHFSRSSLKVGGHAGPGPSPPTFLLSITGRRPQAFQTPLPQSPCPPPPDCSHSPQMGQVLVVVPASCDLRLSWAPHRTRPGFG